ncbi:hypothetical protein GCM10020256_36960 [Streptomyces thermocoprophilus]
MPHPVGGVVATRVHLDGAGVLGAAGDDLDAQVALVGQHQRRLEGQLGHPVAAQLVSGVQDEVQQGGAGHDQPAAHAVVGEPRQVGDRQPAGGDGAVLAGDVQERAEHRVRGGPQPGRGDIGAVLAGEPAPPPVEGVRGQVDGPAAGGERRPVDCRTGGERLREAAQQGVVLAAVPAVQGGDRGGGAVQALLRHRRQHRARADLQERGHLPVVQLPDDGVEHHRAADLLQPVGGLRPGGGDVRAGQVGDMGQPRGAERQLVQDLGERVEHGLHQRGVEGVADGEPLGAPAERVEVRGHGEAGLLVAGDDDAGPAR